MREVGVFLILLLITGSRGFAQPFSAPDQQRESNMVFYEAISLDSPTPGSDRVDIVYRINHEFFIAIRNNGQTPPFLRRGELLIELFDSTGISAAREIRRLDLASQGSAGKNGEVAWDEGVISLSVPPGQYSVLVELDDLESRRKFLDKSRSVRTVNASAVQPGRIQGIFVHLTDVDSGTIQIQPFNYGGGVPFGLRGMILLEIPGTHSSDSSSHNRFRYTVTVPSPRSSRVDTLASGEVTPTVCSGKTLHPNIGWRSPLFTLMDATTNGSDFLLCTIPFHTIPLRTFNLSATLEYGSRQYTLERKVTSIWPDMPMSLKDIDYAIHSLRFIAGPDILDSLKRGSYEERRDRLEAFWRGKDPSPETATNEVMSEYYRRVDHARDTFGTLREPDGTKTDRGRIYILHGPASRTDRTLHPSTGYQEIWAYDTLQKTFIFADQNKTGNYVLLSTQQL